ncbi:MAG: SRPBCC family protein [Woeseiaceae bacterium]|nr:SRPBCC family protein [Woeseiaceae bacterium]
MTRRAVFAWIFAGAAYGVFLRVLFGIAPRYLPVDGVMSAAFLLGTPIAVGAITVWGKRNDELTVSYVLLAPWVTVGLMLVGCAVTLLEGSICIALMAPLFMVCGTVGGIVMGLLLYFGRARKSHVGAVAVLPFIMMIAESFAPLIDADARIRDSVIIDASPQTVWDEIMTAESIRPAELPPSLTHLIGVPRPVEGINRDTPDGEIRYSKWERGVSFEALVTEREPYESIRWFYAFDAHSFPPGSMDEHVEIGGKFFGLEDTTFNLKPLPGNRTELEIIANYRVTSSINFYAVPVAKVLGRDFVRTILGLYKGRSEAASRLLPSTL